MIPVYRTLTQGERVLIGRLSSLSSSASSSVVLLLGRGDFGFGAGAGAGADVALGGCAGFRVKKLEMVGWVLFCDD